MQVSFGLDHADFDLGISTFSASPDLLFSCAIIIHSQAFAVKQNCDNLETSSDCRVRKINPWRIWVYTDYE